MPPNCGGFAIGARDALLWQHYRTLWKCVAEPSGNPSGPPHAARTTHACGVRRAAKTPLTGDKIDAPAACAGRFRTYCGGGVTRTQNVSEYILVLALCLVSC